MECQRLQEVLLHSTQTIRNDNPTQKQNLQGSNKVDGSSQQRVRHGCESRHSASSIARLQGHASATCRAHCRNRHVQQLGVGTNARYETTDLVELEGGGVLAPELEHRVNPLQVHTHTPKNETTTNVHDHSSPPSLQPTCATQGKKDSKSRGHYMCVILCNQGHCASLGEGVCLRNTASNCCTPQPGECVHKGSINQSINRSITR